MSEGPFQAERRAVATRGGRSAKRTTCFDRVRRAAKMNCVCHPRQVAILVGAGLVSEIVYLVLFTWLFPLGDFRSGPLMDISHIALSRRTDVLAPTLSLCLLFTPYIVAWRAIEHLGENRGVMVLVMGFGVLFAFTLVCAHPIGSLDIVQYLFQGRVLADYRMNPFAVAPADLPYDQLVPHLN